MAGKGEQLPSKPRICPKCGSMANHMLPSGKVQCDNPPCGFKGRVPLFRRGGPKLKSRAYKEPDGSWEYLGMGGLWRAPIRYDGDD